MDLTYDEIAQKDPEFAIFVVYKSEASKEKKDLMMRALLQQPYKGETGHGQIIRQ